MIIDREPESFDASMATARVVQRRLKILQVGKFYPPHKGGIESHLHVLCTELQHHVDLSVIVSSDDDKPAKDFVDGVRVLRVPTKATLASTPVCPAMIAEIRDSDADIIHIHLPNPMAVLAYLISGNRAKVVATYHSDTVRQKVLGAAFAPFLNALLRRSAAIIATSPNYVDSSETLSRFKDRCHVIPFGIRLDDFEKCDDSEVTRLRQEYGDRLILSVGRLVYYKGFEYLIRAMSKVRGRLLIVGDGPLREELHALTSTLAVTDKVRFTGRVPQDLGPHYHAADIFALASVARSEAFGIVQIEAMAAGIPVVNTALDSGVPFVSLHEQTGLTVPPADADALAAALNRLLDDTSLRLAYGKAASARARQEFCLDTMIARTLALYNTVAAQTRV